MNPNSVLKNYIQPAFVICSLVLAVAAASMPCFIKGVGGYLEKAPLPLRKSLDLLDETGLTPFTVINKFKIENPEAVKTLGTEKYIDWLLADNTVERYSPVRDCRLFITYYELADIVPHVPEECYVGGGDEVIGSEGITLDVELTGSKIKFPVRYLIFENKQTGLWAGSKFPVCYFFGVNGSFATSREDTRIELNKNLFGKYSYFSKVEWKFMGTNEFSTPVFPNKELAIKESERLLSVILPKLQDKHWPDWKNMNR